MNYRSVADLYESIVRNVGRVPHDVDLIVGIPRSGLMAANLLSLATNLPLTDLEGFLQNRVMPSGFTKPQQHNQGHRHALVVDDSINSGQAMAHARRLVAQSKRDVKVTFCAIYGAGIGHDGTVDLCFEVVPQPRMFQWNLLQHTFLERCCFDIDGVLCADPDEAQNDDGPLYEEFLRNARPLALPSRKVGWLITSRLEKYRPQTEAWLMAHGVAYGALVMLDVASKAERQRRGLHAVHKAMTYSRVPAALFVESDHAQALEIAKRSAKPVLSYQSQVLIEPDATIANIWQRARLSNVQAQMMGASPSKLQLAKSAIRAAIGEPNYRQLKAMVRRRPV